MPFSDLDQEKVKSELLRFKRLMDEFGVKFFLISGTCLGAVREKGFIPWDSDIDIGVLDCPDFYELPQKFEGHYDEVQVVDNVENGAYFFLIKKFAGGAELKIEVRAFYAGGNDEVYFNMNLGKSMFYRDVHLAWPVKLFEQFEEVEMFGERWSVPSPVEEYLSIMYGPEWRKPSQYSDWRYNTKNILDGAMGVEKRILVFGSSRGIGWLLANALVENNFVAECSRTLEPAENYKHLRMKCDVRDEVEVGRFVTAAAEKFGKIDTAIFVAGEMLHGPLWNAGVEDLARLEATTVRGYLYAIQAVLPFFAKEQNGYFINISSTRAVRGYEGRGVYCAVKHAAKALTDVVNEEYNNAGIFATNLHLHIVDTESSRIRYGKTLPAYDPIEEADVLKCVRWLVSLSRNAKPRNIVIGGRCD